MATITIIAGQSEGLSDPEKSTEYLGAAGPTANHKGSLGAISLIAVTYFLVCGGTLNAQLISISCCVWKREERMVQAFQKPRHRERGSIRLNCSIQEKADLILPTFTQVHMEQKILEAPFLPYLHYLEF